MARPMEPTPLLGGKDKELFLKETESVSYDPKKEKFLRECDSVFKKVSQTD